MVGNKNVEFILERRYFLERFWRQISSYDHFRHSTELKAFIRPKSDVPGQQPDIERTLQRISKLPSPKNLMRQYTQAFKFDDNMFKEEGTQAKRSLANATITVFDNFLKQLSLHYKNLRQTIKKLI